MLWVRMSRWTRLRFTGRPRRRSSAWTRGEPSVPLDARWMARISATRVASTWVAVTAWARLAVKA
jgi:hypothetical protein